MPKQPLRKLWSLAAQRLESKEKRRDLLEKAQIEELAQASQDMQDMKDSYDSLTSAAASAANSAYEFSESLRELGTCLLEKKAFSDDEESGRVLLMLGKLQFELRKLVDRYRSHITQTISTPSDSILNELQTVQAMKLHCDEKRVLYERMVESQKGRTKTSNGSFSPKKLQDARQEYEQEATLFVFRLKSLKRGQSRSLLTQAVRHHSAQLSFFRKGVRILERVEPHVRTIAQKQHIDYHFSGLDDQEQCSDGDDVSSTGHGGAAVDNNELSFDFGLDAVYGSRRSSMEMDPVEPTDFSQEYHERPKRGGSLSAAPISVEGKHAPEKRTHTYVLPTPDEGTRRAPPVSYRQAFSGPLPSKGVSALPLPLPTRAPKLGGALQELPRPQPAGRAPLPKTMSPLPRPPVTMARSFSIPSSWQRTSMLTSSTLVKPLAFSDDPRKVNVSGLGQPHQ
ncbi:uncharacterized protein At2g33490-like [Wolffia australiana]